MFRGDHFKPEHITMDMLDALNTIINTFVIKYQGCLIYKLEEGRYKHGDFVGNLDECKARIDETFIKMAKLISK